MKIVVTGMVGVDKKSYLQKVCGLAEKRGKNILLCNVGDMMYSEAPDIPNGRILDISMKRLHQLRRSVFRDIITQSKKSENLITESRRFLPCLHPLFIARIFH